MIWNIKYLFRHIHNYKIHAEVQIKSNVIHFCLFLLVVLLSLYLSDCCGGVVFDLLRLSYCCVELCCCVRN